MTGLGVVNMNIYSPAFVEFSKSQVATHVLVRTRWNLMEPVMWFAVRAARCARYLEAGGQVPYTHLEPISATSFSSSRSLATS